MRQYELWNHDCPREYGVTLSILGDFEKGIAETKEAVRVEPMMPEAEAQTV